MANMYRSVLSGGGAATGDAIASDVLTGKTFSNAQSTGIAGTMPNNGAVTETVTAGQTYTIPAGYHNGSGTVTGGGVTPALLTVTQGAISFDAVIGKTYVVCKNAASGASVSISGGTVLDSANITTTASIVHTWAITATSTTISISGASTGDIAVYQLD